MIKIKTYLKPIAIFIGVGIISALIVSITYADSDLMSVFPLNHYDQTISTWIKPSDANYDKPLLSSDMQKARMDIFYDHYIGSHSPWNAEYVTQILRSTPQNNFKSEEENIIHNFDNEDKDKPEKQIGYGENFRPYAKDWIEKITNNINLSQFDNLTYQINHRGIAVDNLHARALPTDDVYFYSPKLAGQGYPFDNLQISALWAGTPVYIIGETRDHAWMLVITPDYIGWVKSNGIARVDNAFINTWTSAAKNKLLAITKTQTSIIDQNRKFLFSAYVGAVFPKDPDSIITQIMVPVINDNGFAEIRKAVVSSEDVVVMPETATPHHFSNIIHTLIGRPYGWGGMYFYNDCSSELKSLFTPFGIWLPRHSTDQLTAGKIVDLNAETKDKRLHYLTTNGKSFLTLIYNGGHIILYIGNYPNPRHQNALMAMTYQNMWGLSPTPPTRRAVIGKAVFFPLLLQYPEDLNLNSQANKKDFQLSFLNELPNTNATTNENIIDIKALMFPDGY